MATIEFYLARAADCGRDADKSTLDNVRERMLNAQAVWLDMAERLERTNESRAADASRKLELASQSGESGHS